MTKTKKIKVSEETTQEGFPLIPPEVHFLSDRYVVELPLSATRSRSPWDLRVHVAKTLESELGDSVELTSMKVKMPRLIARGAARLKKREPCARAYVTIKF